MDARNKTACAISSGFPILFNGILSNNSSFEFNGRLSVISVSIQPGAMQLTVIPLDPTSLATDWVRPLNPDFEEA